MGVIKKRLGDFSKAKEYYEKSIESNPKFPFSHLNLGVIYREKGNYNKAIEIITNGIYENPEVGFLYYNRACFYSLIGEYEKALDGVLKAIELDDFFIEYMKKDKELDPIRSLPRYKERFL